MQVLTEEMELRKLDVSEVKSRQAELAKMRSLLFHAEIKVLRLLALLVQRYKYWRRRCARCSLPRADLGEALLQ